MNPIFTPNTNKKYGHTGTVPNTPAGLEYIRNLRKTKRVLARGRNPDRKGLVTAMGLSPSDEYFKYRHRDVRKSLTKNQATHFALYVSDKNSRTFTDHVLPNCKIKTQKQRDENKIVGVLVPLTVKEVQYLASFFQDLAEKTGMHSLSHQANVNHVNAMYFADQFSDAVPIQHNNYDGDKLIGAVLPTANAFAESLNSSD